MRNDGHITFRRFRWTVTHLPVTRYQICDRTLAYRPGNISEILTSITAGPIPKHSASLAVTSVTAHSGRGL